MSDPGGDERRRADRTDDRLWDGFDAGEESGLGARSRNRNPEDTQRGTMDRDREVPPEPSGQGHPSETTHDRDSPPGDLAALQPLYRARRREFYALWFLAVLAYGVGDSLTTGLAVIEPGVVETNPVVALVLAETSIVGFFALKLALFVVLIAISAKGAIDGDRLAYYAPPVFALGLGTALTVWNLFSVGFL